MITVTVVAILAGIALYEYNDYAPRARITEVVGIAGADMGSVAEYVQSRKGWPATYADLGMSQTVSSPYIAGGLRQHGFPPTGSILSFPLSTKLAPDMKGNLIYAGTLGADLSVQWSCTSSTAPKKYLPAECR